MMINRENKDREFEGMGREKMVNLFYQETMKKMMAQVAEQLPVTRPFPKQRHLVTPLTIIWLISSSPNAANPYTVDASVSYTQ
jgi:hypothetical protein